MKYVYFFIFSFLFPIGYPGIVWSTIPGFPFSVACLRQENARELSSLAFIICKCKIRCP